MRAQELKHQSRRWLLFFTSFILPWTMSGHPILTEPVKHPFVFTFDQFHLPQDGDESVLQGGLLLMAETRCTACHEAPTTWQEHLASSPGPNLSGVGSRLPEDSIWLLVRSPQHRKPGTLMPGLFHGSEDDAEKVEALTQYLFSLKQKMDPLPIGDIQRGKELYHTVGCVACHEPALDYRPPTANATDVIERPGYASVPIALADAYDTQALGHFLLNPHNDRPAGRMPSLHLKEQEAADIAAYLQLGRTAEKTEERRALRIAPQTVETGRQLFVQQRCSNCHNTGETNAKKPAQPLQALNTDSSTGCLAETTRAGVPRFDFNPLQRRALRLALKQVQQQAPPPRSASQRIDWQMLRLNCYACHDRHAKGSPEDTRAQYFLSARQGTEGIANSDRLPPSLDRAGWKLTADWLQRVLHGTSYAVRPSLVVRMPDFGKANTEMLPKLFIEADQPSKPPPRSASKEPVMLERGRQLMGSTGLGCIHCHGLKENKPSKQLSVDLTDTVHRLSFDYFKEVLLHPALMQPDARMPALFSGRDYAQREIESIWNYLQQVETQPLPENLSK